MIEAISHGRDVLWIGPCNIGKSAVSSVPATISALNLLPTFCDKHVFLLVPTVAVLLSLRSEHTRYQHPYRMVTPGHGIDEKMTLLQAFQAKDATLVVCHPSKLVSMFKLKAEDDDADDLDTMALIQNINKSTNLGSKWIVIFDEIHTYFTMPYDSYNQSVILVKSFFPNAHLKVGCTATLPLGENALDVVHEKLKQRKNCFVLIESSRRPEIQRVVVTPSSHLVQMREKEYLENHSVPIAAGQHDWAIVNNGVHVVYASDEKGAKAFIKVYLKTYPGCTKEEVGLMLGSTKQSKADQTAVFDLIMFGTINLVVVTCMLALGANIHKIISLQILCDPYDGITLEQLLNRVLRGKFRAGFVVIMVSVTHFNSDFQNVRHDTPGNYAADISRKRLMRDIVLSASCQHSILDKYNPHLQIDGVLTSSSVAPPFTCGNRNMCLACQLGVDLDVDVSRDGWIVLLAVKETLGYLPATILEGLLKGVEGKNRFSDLGMHYFEKIYECNTDDFKCRGMLRHGIRSQVIIL